MPKVVVGYTRVSTGRQANEGVSLEAQQERIKAWAKYKGRELRNVHVDAGLSGGRAANRPALQAALDEVCREKGVLVVYSLSRLARSTKDCILIGERLKECGADLVSLSEDINTASAAGKLFYRLLAAMAEFESDVISERTAAALSHKRAKGEKLGGSRPFGYTVEDGKLVPLPAEQKAIKRAKKLVGKHSLRATARILHSEGLTDREFHPQSISRALRARTQAAA